MARRNNPRSRKPRGARGPAPKVGAKLRAHTAKRRALVTRWGPGKAPARPHRPTFQARHHQAIAQALALVLVPAGLRPTVHVWNEEAPWAERIFWELAKLFQRDNPNFDYVQFRKVAEGDAK